MKWCIPVVIVLEIFLCLVPSAGALLININASPADPHIGDTVMLRGNVTGIKTIAVYLFLVGQDLDPYGVTLDNLNIPAGRGLFTTAPVNLDNGSWNYEWDTSAILGELKPGKYTIYAVISPMDRLRLVAEERATAEITFLPSDKPVTEVPLSPAVPVAAVFIAGLIVCCAMHRRER
ncbi:MAG: hypothetical protein NTZ39_09795 [Methanoregula sp.]|nr:hypothetical protein [Methanoregula sp.]